MYNGVYVFTELAGSTALEEAQTLMIGSCATDTLAPLLKMHGLKDEEAKASTRSTYVVGFVNIMHQPCNQAIKHFIIHNSC